MHHLQKMRHRFNAQKLKLPKKNKINNYCYCQDREKGIMGKFSIEKDMDDNEERELKRNKQKKAKLMKLSDM